MGEDWEDEYYKAQDEISELEEKLELLKNTHINIENFAFQLKKKRIIYARIRTVYRRLPKMG